MAIDQGPVTGPVRGGTPLGVELAAAFCFSAVPLNG